MKERVEHWLRLMGGPLWEGPEARDRAIKEMRALGTTTVFPLLEQKLSDPDLENRCAAIEALGVVDPARAVNLLIPLLGDPEDIIRLCACEFLAAPEAVAAVEPLIVVLKNDLDPMVRNYAARALGHIGSRIAIPALLHAMDADHEPDMHCHTPSHCAATALDDMLGTEFTRIRVSQSTCTMRPGPPDLDGLRKRAIQEHENWQRSRARRIF